jgi:hypothetical protein
MEGLAEKVTFESKEAIVQPCGRRAPSQGSSRCRAPGTICLGAAGPETSPVGLEGER